MNEYDTSALCIALIAFPATNVANVISQSDDCEILQISSEHYKFPCLINGCEC